MHLHAKRTTDAPLVAPRRGQEANKLKTGPFFNASVVVV